ncbi:Type II inositol-1,4,5-trisphosphate 5-phosphatase [Giardia muris]|uniref:Type II inositol-1,4,5-trisphosphate 5-phosphatase n=1 Tax=Giardia muris TaxID=5742 RepID=A0A4Z1TAY8_GIAMU|nr:Type II inositol-1,4,5-trisphosphate 5-phosphatase [Giardia muris]|eukprot:TNJ29699.1 Type II inositol-1,4,5-trisphosphate 5-phosphatase [Giardia muris]
MDTVFDYSQLKLGIMTFNVKEREPNAQIARQIAAGTALADLVILGFQEIDMSIGANTRKSKRITKWETLLDDEFVKTKGTQKYVRLASHYMMGIVTIIYTTLELLKRMHDIEVSSVCMGAGKIFGNKGGIAVSLCIDSTSYLFLNCHLLHGEEGDDLAKRLSQLDNFFNQTSTTLCSLRSSGDSRLAVEQFNDTRGLQTLNLMTRDPSLLCRTNHEGLPIFDSYDYIVLLGDLNFRVDKLTRIDQLETQMLSDKFILKSNGFEEPRMVFPPTYKYDRNGSLNPEREPSWPDRILISKRYSNLSTNFLSYTSLQESNFSDHKAVFQVVELSCRTLSPERFHDGLRSYCADWDAKTLELNPVLKYLQNGETSLSLLSVSSNSVENSVVLRFEIVCGQSLVPYLIIDITGADDDIFSKNIISKAKVMICKGSSDTQTVTRSSHGGTLAHLTAEVTVDIKVRKLCKYLQRIYSLKGARELLGRDLRIPLIASVTSSNPDSFFYTDANVDFSFRVRDHLFFYSGLPDELLKVPPTHVSLSTFDVLHEPVLDTPTEGALRHHAVLTCTEPLVFPIIATLLKKAPSFETIRSLHEALMSRIAVIDCSILEEGTSATATIRSKLEQYRSGNEGEMTIAANVTEVLRYMVYVRDYDPSLYQSTVAAVASALFRLSRDSLPWDTFCPELVTSAVEGESTN